MAIENVSKPSSSISNATRINIGLTWDADTLQWQNESRTWDDTQSVIDNITKGTTGFLWSVSRFPWTEATPWLTEGGITNVNRP